MLDVRHYTDNSYFKEHDGFPLMKNQAWNVWKHFPKYDTFIHDYSNGTLSCSCSWRTFSLNLKLLSMPLYIPYLTVSNYIDWCSSAPHLALNKSHKATFTKVIATVKYQAKPQSSVPIFSYRKKNCKQTQSKIHCTIMC